MKENEKKGREIIERERERKGHPMDDQKYKNIKKMEENGSFYWYS